MSLPPPPGPPGPPSVPPPGSPDPNLPEGSGVPPAPGFSQGDTVPHYDPPSATPMAPTGGYAPQGSGADNGMGTTALVMGILQFFCLGTIGSILAIVFGKIGMDKADRGEANNRGVAKAGFILGIVGVVITAIGAIIAVILLVTGAAVVNQAAKDLATTFPSGIPTALPTELPTSIPDSATGYNETIKKNFLDSCVSSATGNPQATAICKCAFRGIEKNISFDDFLAADKAAGSGSTLSNQITSIVQKCASDPSSY